MVLLYSHLHKFLTLFPFFYFNVNVQLNNLFTMDVWIPSCNHLGSFIFKIVLSTISIVKNYSKHKKLKIELIITIML